VSLIADLAVCIADPQTTNLTGRGDRVVLIRLEQIDVVTALYFIQRSAFPVRSSYRNHSHLA